jgi:hypothetical protein
VPRHPHTRLSAQTAFFTDDEMPFDTYQNTSLEIGCTKAVTYNPL